MTLSLSIAEHTRILTAVADAFSTTPTAILSRDRHRTVSHARQTTGYLMRRLGLSYPEVGRELGVDHTSVMAACRRIGDALRLGTLDGRWVARIRVAEAALGLGVVKGDVGDAEARGAA